MGGTESRKSQATFDSNQACCRSCESAETYSVRAAKSQKKKKTTKIAGGVASAAALGAGALAGGTAVTIASVGTIVSVTVGIPTLGVGLLVGFAATAGTAAVAAGMVGVGGALATHYVAKHYKEDEATFREAQGDFRNKCAHMTHEDVAYNEINMEDFVALPDIFPDTEWSDAVSVTTAKPPQILPTSTPNCKPRHPLPTPTAKPRQPLPTPTAELRETLPTPTARQHQHQQLLMHTLLDVSSRPRLNDVFQQVVTPVAAKWESVAISLGIETCMIDIISKNHPKDCQQACLDMLKRWLSKEHYTGEEERTWSTLLSALEAADCAELRQRLQREHFT